MVKAAAIRALARDTSLTTLSWMRAYRQRPGMSDYLRNHLDRLIELSTATDKPDEAKKWRAERAKYPFVAPPPREVKR